MADLQKYADDFLSEMIDEAILGTCFEVHRSSRVGTLFIDDVDPEEEEKYKIVDQPGFDVFGVPKSGSKKTIECECPNCKRTLAASRFAPHLEKCMGMGRNSSRIASQRIANSGKLAAGLGESLCNDDDPEFGSDADWFLGYEGGSSTRRNSKKRKGERISGSPRIRGPLAKTKAPNSSPRSNGSGGSSRSGTADHNDNVPIDVVNPGGALIEGRATPTGSDSLTPSMRNKSPFDPSLGTWEPQITESKTPENIHTSAGGVKKKSKSTKHTTKKSKKRHNLAQNYTFS
uniref:SAGA-associated factor 11 homolog n=1 Tax=Styela clava TaxID=7725 RepID=UPI00193998E5|nr:SAGA-associated factor 11 homolog [Styela clava]XP_039257352.1 SAGA-associated factor 11 homolog [Styela clava]